MKKIYKGGNDFAFALQIITSDEDFKPRLTRIRKFREVNIKVYTNDIDEYILASYKSAGSGTWANIIEQKDYDFLILNRNDLNKLGNGVLKIQIDYKLGSGIFDTNTYMETYNFETEYYLYDKLYDSSNCPSCRLIND